MGGTTARRILLVAVLALLVGAGSADAALKKYITRRTSIAHAGTASPDPLITRNTRSQTGEVLTDVAVVDDSVSPPVLVKLSTNSDFAGTVEVPSLSGFIFVSRKTTETIPPDHTGVSGATASQIDWGTVTGWQLTGTHWCNSEPATVCLLAGDTDEDTNSDPPAPSPFYDLGTWVFHGTGFTSTGFVYSRSTTNYPGANQQYFLRGALGPDGSVPTLPVAGVLLLGAATLAAGAAALRRGEATRGSAS